MRHDRRVTRLLREVTPERRTSLALLLAAASPVPCAAQEPELATLCADCHPAESAGWRETGMARALGPLTSGEIEELRALAPVLEEPTGLRYSFEGDGELARIVETREAKDGGAPWRDSATLLFAIGAGELDRSFVAARNSRMWLAPLEVVSIPDKEAHAALAPGHEISPGTRFSLPVTPECLACHTDSPPPRSWPLNLVPGKGWQARGISCAACHARAAEHARWRESELAGEGSPAADPILDLDALGRNERMSICAACHLQGDARIELEKDRVGPPVPGGDVLEKRAVFVAAQPTGEIGFVSQVQRLVLSRCYLESEALSCETCHDPHRLLADPREAARVRAACASCHAETAAEGKAHACSLAPEERAAGRDCVACHMPRRGVFDVAEVEVHDHWIRKLPGAAPGRAPLRFPESATGDWKRFAWPGSPPPAHGGDPGLHMMALAHGRHVERALELVDREPGPLVRELPMYHHVRGSLLELGGRRAEARAAYVRALQLDPELAESVTNLAPLLAQLGEPRAGLALLDRLLAKHPLADGALRNRALIKLALGDETGFVADLEKAMELLPDANLARALASACERRGDPASARRWSEEAKRLDPRSE